METVTLRLPFFIDMVKIDVFDELLNRPSLYGPIKEEERN